MKYTLYSLLPLFVLLLAACGQDDDDMMMPEPVCSQADWVGTYTGTVTCDGDTDPGTVTITASGTNAIIIEYETDFVTTTYDPLPFTNCTLIQSVTQSGITVSVDSELEGDQLTIVETITNGGNTTTCEVTATRD